MVSAVHNYAQHYYHQLPSACAGDHVRTILCRRDSPYPGDTVDDETVPPLPLERFALCMRVVRAQQSGLKRRRCRISQPLAAALDIWRIRYTGFHPWAPRHATGYSAPRIILFLGVRGMSSLLRVRVSSFLAGIAVAGSAALYWLRDDVRHSFETLHTHVSVIDPLTIPPLHVLPTIEQRLGPVQTEGFSTKLDRRVHQLEERVATLEDSKGTR